ncbi:MAG: aspartate kinase, partial [Bacillus sp. (in: firmicutes)]
MKIIVQKFGGTSVKDENSRKYAQGHIEKALADGYKVVVVVSAMGRKGDPYATDTLLSLVGGNLSKISRREHDLLLSCGEVISSVVFVSMLIENGINAVALTGAQAGFRTNNDHTNAKINDMQCDRLLSELEN